MNKYRQAYQTAPFLKAESKYDAQYPVSSFKADLPAIYETPMICRHLRQDVVSNPTCGWWIVDTTLFEYGKGEGCYICPL